MPGGGAQIGFSQTRNARAKLVRAIPYFFLLHVRCAVPFFGRAVYVGVPFHVELAVGGEVSLSNPQGQTNSRTEPEHLAGELSQEKE
jgi:hypothetical protein